jgi:hypothetical protein
VLPRSHSNIQFHDNLSSGSRLVPFRQTDRHVEANITLFAIYERAQKWQSQSFHGPQSPSREAYTHRNGPKIYDLGFIKPDKLLPCSQNLSWRFILILFPHQSLSLPRRFLPSCFLINFSHVLFSYPHQRYKPAQLHGLNWHILIFGFYVTFSIPSLTEQKISSRFGTSWCQVTRIGKTRCFAPSQQNRKSNPLTL